MASSPLLWFKTDLVGQRQFRCGRCDWKYESDGQGLSWRRQWRRPVQSNFDAGGVRALRRSASST